MAFLKWTPDLSVGIELIDTQHQELFRRVDQLIGSMAAGGSRNTVLETAKFLEEYVVTHFTDEQAEMERAGYPAYRAHREEHEAFIADLQLMKREYYSDGSLTHFAISVNNRVCKWLVEHVLRADRAFAAFHRRQQARSFGHAPPAAGPTR